MTPQAARLTDSLPFNCPVCESVLTNSPFIRESTPKGEVGIVRCLGCGLHLTWPRLAEPQNDYMEFSLAAWDKKYGAIDRGERRHDRHANYLEEVHLIGQYLPQGRILDVGCNAGWLLGYLKQSGRPYELEGLEPSPTLGTIAQRRLGIPIHSGYLQSLKTPPYDALIATDVIEHITPEDLQAFLEAVRRLLKPGGHIFLKTPNARFTALKSNLTRKMPGFVRGLMLKSPDVWDAKEHVVHWDAPNLARLLTKHGFKPVRIFVPRPIQTRNSPLGAYLMRAAIYYFALLSGGNQAVPAFAQDIFVVAQA